MLPWMTLDLLHSTRMSPDPVQLTLVTSGGLGLAVSVVSRLASDRAPSLLAVKASTDSSYSVAGSTVTRSDLSFN